MARRIVVAGALCALAAAVPAGSASAHAGNPNYESLVRGITPQIPGLSVEVLNGDDRLEVHYNGTQTVTVEGYNHDPYLRLRSGGIVEVNLRSPAYYLNQDRFLGAKVPAIADPKAPPRWQLVAHTGRYEFHDHRMHWMATGVPEQVKDRSKRTKIVDWRVPLRAQGTSGAITGELFWRGSGPGAPVAAFVALGAIMLLGGALVVLVRRRRASAAGEPGSEAW
jgi:LPXTG-motif cell wall-anchored protein